MSSRLSSRSQQLTERSRASRDGFFSSTSSGAGDRKYDPRSIRSDSKDKDSEKMNSTTSIQSYHTSQHEKPVKEAEGYVGFANLPNQVYRKSVKKGFEFTLMVVGE